MPSRSSGQGELVGLFLQRADKIAHRQRGQRRRRDDLARGDVVDDGAIHADRGAGEAGLDHRAEPPDRAAGSDHHPRPRLTRSRQRVDVALADPITGLVQQGAVHVGDDHHRRRAGVDPVRPADGIGAGRGDERGNCHRFIVLASTDAQCPPSRITAGTPPPGRSLARACGQGMSLCASSFAKERVNFRAAHPPTECSAAVIRGAPSGSDRRPDLEREWAPS